MSKKLLIVVVSLFGLNSLAYSQENCASNSIVSSTWPSHNHQFFGDGNVYSITTGTVQNFAGVVSYEGVSAASDDQGNLIFFTNGR